MRRMKYYPNARTMLQDASQRLGNLVEAMTSKQAVAALVAENSKGTVSESAVLKFMNGQRVNIGTQTLDGIISGIQACEKRLAESCQ